MSIHCIRRTAWLLPLLVFATPMLVPLAGRNRPKPPQADESAESPEFTGIVYHIIANEWKMRGKMQEFSPRVETYLQYYRPDSELGDVATSDDYFLGRLKFSKTMDNQAMEESFLPDATEQWLLRRPDLLRAHI